ncbi:hypothetical protein AKJ54_00585 [candidate division MSBL1 archaeon SCGC-AAA382K21]|uniref:FAD-binding domain-containing protein n=1 Tax=candidate division MSBL1 archaeon SCGC-AAA382K21 TaxID=1698283 RepID=A0A133VL63_9EURY|nr:hypothetical protein AKJ54_00585 [candidate division MSBL1 archaeon SCGC-AAA382K21]
MYDVTIIGGGPSGCLLGKNLAKKGFEVAILEEDPEIGQPMCCAGIVGAEGLKEINLDPESWSLRELRGGTFHCPTGETVKLSRGRTEAHVIDRAKFDRDLAEKAVRAGAELKLKNRVRGISRNEKGVTLLVKKRGGSEEVKSRMIVGADGPNSLVARTLDLMKNFSPTIAAQAEVVKKSESRNAHVYLGNDLSKNFFGWAVPTGDIYRVGLGDKNGNVVRKLINFLEDEPSLPEDSRKKIVRLTTGLIPTPGSRKIYGERVILVGDAAGHVKPLTGGGLYLGLSIVEIASEILTKALEGEPTEENLREYRKAVSEKYGKEFKMGARVRRILQKASDDDITEFLKLLTVPEIRDIILKNADFDNHSKLFRELMKNGPSLISAIGTRKLMKYLGWFAKT